MEIPIDRVLPGDILDEDIIHGRALLFPKGASVTEQTLAALRQRQVATVCVIPRTGTPVDAALLARAAHFAKAFHGEPDPASALDQALFELRVRGEVLRLEQGRPPLAEECPGEVGEAVSPESLPAFCLDRFSPPELPSVVVELNQLLSSPQASSQKVAELVGCTPGLAARLLRVVNSPLYGLQGRVDSLSRAVSIVGMREVGMLASGLVMIEQFGVIPRTVIGMRSFLEHSLGCAVVARALAEIGDPAGVEQTFVGGLLHDIGRLYFFTAFPERSRYCLRSARKHGRSLADEEQAFFGTDHAALGGALLRQWQMPEALCRAVSGHHAPPGGEGLTCRVHVADAVVHAMGVGCSGRGAPPCLLREEVERTLGDLAPRITTLSVAVRERVDTLAAAFA